MEQIRIRTLRPRVEEILARYETHIGKDFAGYRNHVYRTISYAMHFLNQDERYEKLVETAFAYHDIGLWTDRELAYLEPSEAVALSDNQRWGWGLDPELLRLAIHWHHKITPYRNPAQPEWERVVEACRKADWIDASMGMLRKGLRKADIQTVEAAFENAGFHQTLMRLTKDLGGNTLLGTLKVTKGIVRW